MEDWRKAKARLYWIEAGREATTELAGRGTLVVRGRPGLDENERGWGGAGMRLQTTSTSRGLLDLTAQTVADMIKGKTPEEIRTDLQHQE
ncbi:hypothetical protein PR202_ga31375 [Eleusine coracana subsp. coracana]|uniref:SKP1 component dimerisation domain-containing protein n=1 Tax=Eleusine coracana subsp. coracana TaxID=191504 RepID=A0AAV5DRR7_ELECO|nr:hypothetical protein PR202_ga31375 [Eleusine coracana subsp. coracana]